MERQRQRRVSLAKTNKSSLSKGPKRESRVWSRLQGMNVKGYGEGKREVMETVCGKVYLKHIIEGVQ